MLATDIDVTELTEASEEYVEQVSQAVATDTETAGYVEELERRRTHSTGWRSSTTSSQATHSLPRSPGSCASARRTVMFRSRAGQASALRGVFDVRG